MPFGVSEQLAEKIKKQQEVKGALKPSDVEFRESQVITESEITTRNQEKSPDSDTGVANAPEVQSQDAAETASTNTTREALAASIGNLQSFLDSQTETVVIPDAVNTIAPVVEAPPAVEKSSTPAVEPIATIATIDKNDAERLKEADLEKATAALDQLDFMIGNQLMNNESTKPSEADGIISSIGHYINEIPDNDKISMEVRTQLNDRYEKIKNGLGELIFTQAGNFVRLSQGQKDLLDEMRIRLIDKKF